MAEDSELNQRIGCGALVLGVFVLIWLINLWYRNVYPDKHVINSCACPTEQRK